MKIKESMGNIIVPVVQIKTTVIWKNIGQNKKLQLYGRIKNYSYMVEYRVG